MSEPSHLLPKGARGTTRRSLLGFGAWSALAAALPFPARALAATRGERALSFYNIHTSEQLRVVYWADGAYLKPSLAEVDQHLRDHRTGEVRSIEPSLLDLLHDLRAALGSQEPFNVISGYRSPKTNAMLASRGNGVGRKSLHMQGQAVDVSLAGRDVAELRRAAIALRAGGVGYYPGPGFVHVDVGRVRTW